MRSKREWKTKEVADCPDLLGIARDVAATDEPRLLQADGDELAVVIPVALARTLGLRGPITEQDDAAFRALAGVWNDVDADEFVDEIYADRGRPVNPPIER